ncbi:MAG: prepilin-type N-terminal cleavage/methylation domain-containing protein, partial [Vagococcus sp.]
MLKRIKHDRKGFTLLETLLVLLVTLIFISLPIF